MAGWWVRQDGSGPVRQPEGGCPITSSFRSSGSASSSSAPSASAPAPGSVGARGEFAVIGRLTAGLAPGSATTLGPGDDAAVVTAADGRVVASVDVLVDGVHFRTDWASGEQIGRRAALASMADIAAMGAVPTALLVGLTAPADVPEDLVLGLGRGIDAEAAAVGAGLVGGDLTRSEVLTLSVTVLGDLRGAAPVTRSGARPGQVVAVAGRLGWAAAGLTVLSRGFRSPAAVVGAYRVPEPPLAQGPVAAAAGAGAMIDVSDGLLADLGHIAVASGVTIDVHTARLPVAPRLVEVASALGRDPLEWVLTGGDDHALAATFAPDAVPAEWTVIGEVLASAGDGGPTGEAAHVVTVDGVARDTPGGWDHFTS